MKICVWYLDPMGISIFDFIIFHRKNVFGGGNKCDSFENLYLTAKLYKFNIYIYSLSIVILKQTCFGLN